jgi:Leucine-rich repeat (LRR) protein
MQKQLLVMMGVMFFNINAMQLESEMLDLTLSDRPITRLKEQDPKNIKEICLVCNDLKQWPHEQLKRFSNLEALTFSQQKLLYVYGVNFEEGYLQHLRILVLSYNHLQTLSPAIKVLTALRELYVGDNKLEWLPEELAELKLKKLSLPNNQLKRLPESISLLKTSLGFLYLQGNQFLPNEIKRIREALPDTMMDIEPEAFETEGTGY